MIVISQSEGGEATAWGEGNGSGASVAASKYAAETAVAAREFDWPGAKAWGGRHFVG